MNSRQHVHETKRKPLPDAPLELCDPISLPAGGVPGARVLAELDPEPAVLLFDIFQVLCAWAADGGKGGWYDPADLRRWRCEVRAGHCDEQLKRPVTALLRQLGDAGTSEPAKLSSCCREIAEWAHGRGATDTSLEFHRLAALVCPTNARVAYLTARTYGRMCHFKEADIWLRRAARVSRWYRDWETYADALNSIGTVAYRVGNIPRARLYLDRALRVARRHGLKRLEGEIYHDRFTVAFTSGEKTDAEALARAAFERYLPSHGRLPALAYDVAYYWLTKGYAARALRLLRLLRPHFPQPEPQFQVLCACARAAGALGDRATFRSVWLEAIRLLEAARNSPAFAIALIDLGYGAGHIRDWQHAEAAFLQAYEAATANGQEEDRVLAEVGLRAVRQQENPDPLPPIRGGAESTELDRLILSHLDCAATVGADSEGRLRCSAAVSLETPSLLRPIPLVLLSAPSLHVFVSAGTAFRTRSVVGWAALRDVLRDAGPDSVVLLDPYADERSAPSPELFAVLETFPSITVVAAFELTPERVGDVRQMLQAGLSGIVNVARDGTAPLAARRLRDAVGRPFKRQVELLVPPHLSADARAILRGACEVAVLGGGVDALADLFGVNQKTLSGWCQKFHLGTTRSLLLWLRLLLAAVLLEDVGRTVQSAATATGYSSDRALRRAFETALGSALRDVRRGGALAQVSQRFRERLIAIAAERRR